MRRCAALLLAIGLVGCSRARAELPSSQVRAAFDRYRQPERLVAALGLRAGDRVADVGAGTGYLTFRLAQAVGARGAVLATDVDAEALAAIDRAAQPAELRARVHTRRVAAADPGLEAEAYDLILMSEVDHLLPDRVAYLRQLAFALAPGGRIAVTNRRTFRAPLEAAAAAAGLRARAVELSPTHYLTLLARGAL